MALMCSNVFAGDSFIDGHEVDDVTLVKFQGISTAGSSALGEANLYYDVEDSELYISKDGGLYEILGSGGGGGGATDEDFNNNNTLSGFIYTVYNVGIHDTTPDVALDVVGDTIISGGLIVGGDGVFSGSLTSGDVWSNGSLLTPDTGTTYTAGTNLNLGGTTFNLDDNVSLQGSLSVNRDLTVTGNIAAGGTVDGIDIATDVGANTTHRGLTAPHIEWAVASQGTVHATNYVDNDTTYVAGDFAHDSLASIPANDHIDWTSTSSNFNTSGTTTASGNCTLDDTLTSVGGVWKYNGSELGTGSGGGATTSASGVTYVTNQTDDFVVGGTTSASPLFYDEGLEILYPTALSNSGNIYTETADINNTLTVTGNSLLFGKLNGIGDSKAHIGINEGGTTTSLISLSNTGVNISLESDVQITGSLSIEGVLTNTGSLYYLIVDDDGNVYKVAM